MSVCSVPSCVCGLGCMYYSHIYVLVLCVWLGPACVTFVDLSVRPCVLWAHTLDLAGRLGVRGPWSAAPEASACVELSPCLALGQAKARLKRPAVPREPTCPVRSGSSRAGGGAPASCCPGSAPPGEAEARGGRGCGRLPLPLQDGHHGRPGGKGSRRGAEVPSGRKRENRQQRKRKKIHLERNKC